MRERDERREVIAVGPTNAIIFIYVPLSTYEKLHGH
jgi:hypothetical protein